MVFHSIYYFLSAHCIELACGVDDARAADMAMAHAHA